MDKELMQELNQSQWFVVHLTDSACAVCEIVGIKLQEACEGRDHVTYKPLSTNLNPSLIQDFQVKIFPTVLLYFEGKEYGRYEQVFSVEALLEALDRFVSLSCT